jgi:hypothetical protein
MKTQQKKHTAFALFAALIIAAACILAACPQEPDPVGTETAGVSVTFTGFTDEAIDLTPSAANDLSKAAGNSLTITVQGEWDSCRFYYDYGSYYDSTSGTTLTIYASNCKVGVHRVTALVVKDGVPWSKEITFRVVY